MNTPSKKKLIEAAYERGEDLGLIVLCQDEAGPYQTKPYPGMSWQAHDRESRYPHEYIRDGVAKIMTLLRPKTGIVRVKGTTTTKNDVLHPWIKSEIEAILEVLAPLSKAQVKDLKRRVWKHFSEAFSSKESFDSLPTPRVLLIWDNLAGHKSYAMVRWLYERGVVPLYTPLAGSWLNMAESIQNILKARALNGTHPQSPQQIIDSYEATARGWNKAPTPFEWGGKRLRRRRKAWERAKLAASGGFIHREKGCQFWYPI